MLWYSDAIHSAIVSSDTTPLTHSFRWIGIIPGMIASGVVGSFIAEHLVRLQDPHATMIFSAVDSLPLGSSRVQLNFRSELFHSVCSNGHSLYIKELTCQFQFSKACWIPHPDHPIVHEAAEVSWTSRSFRTDCVSTSASPLESSVLGERSNQDLKHYLHPYCGEQQGDSCKTSPCHCPRT